MLVYGVEEIKALRKKGVITLVPFLLGI